MRKSRLIILTILIIVIILTILIILKTSNTHFVYFIMWILTSVKLESPEFLVKIYFSVYGIHDHSQHRMENSENIYFGKAEL